MGKKQQTSEDMIEWLKNDDRGIVLVGEYVTSLTKTTFECVKGHRWDTRPNGIKNGKGCPVCNGGSHNAVSNKKELVNKLLTDGRGISLIGEYINAQTKTLFKCSSGHFWEAKPHSVKNIGSGCPACADHSGGGFKVSKPAWEYAFVRENYLKFGITNNLSNRLADHKRCGDFTLVHSRYHENGQQALDWENLVKKKFGGNFVSKRQCPDGYTETLPSHLLETIINLNNQV